jgi:hypothetical protein
VPLLLDDLIEALILVSEHPQFFLDQENLCLYDAMIAAIWRRTRATLATSDRNLIKFGRNRGLSVVRLRKTKLRNLISEMNCFRGNMSTNYAEGF